MNSRPRVPLAQLPTPIQRLPRLRELLDGPQLSVKRDDQTGLAFGGNKTRKLETLCAAALAAGADLLVTAGAVQSNHCRQTAAAAAHLGLGCILVLVGEKTHPPPIYYWTLCLARSFAGRAKGNATRLCRPPLTKPRPPGANPI